MRPIFSFKSILVLFTVIFVTSSLSVPIVLAQDQDENTGGRWWNGVWLYESKSIRSEGYYPFAGGGSCCGCGTKHYGTLPDDFPKQDIAEVTFFLLTSRSNSLYTEIEVGDTRLTFTLTEPAPSTKTYSVTATSTEAKNETLPIDVPWYITFEFDTPVKNVGSGWRWEIGDGDSNLLSAVWLHMSDADTQGLPGTAETYDCSYRETRNGWYSVMFKGTSSDVTPTPPPDEESKPTCSVVRTVTKVSGSNTYDVTLTITNTGDVTATQVTFAEQLIDLQYVGEPGESAGFEVYQYKTLGAVQSDYEVWIYSGVMDEAGQTIEFAPGDTYSFNYQVVPIIDADCNWTTQGTYLGYSNQATGKSAFGCTKLGFLWDSDTKIPNLTSQCINNTLDTVDGKPIGQADAGTDMLIVSSPGAIIENYATTDAAGDIDNSDAYRLLGEMAKTASEQNGILSFIELGQNDDWTNVDTAIEQWVNHELMWNVQDDSEYYLMIVGNDEIIPFAQPNDPLSNDSCPSDTYYADINEDWIQDLCVGRIIAWEIDDLIRLMSTTSINAGNGVTIAYDTDIHHKGQEQATADPEYFTDWCNTLIGYLSSGTVSYRTVIGASPIGSGLRSVDDLFKNRAVFLCAGHGEHDSFCFYEMDGSTTAVPYYLTTNDFPDNAADVYITCLCLTAHAINGHICDGCQDSRSYESSISLACINSGAYAYVGATLKAKTNWEGTIGAAQFTTDLVQEWLDEEQTIGMAFKEAMQNLIDTAPNITNVFNYDTEVKRTFLEYVLYGNPKFTLDPLPGGGIAAITTSAPGSLLMHRGNPKIEVDLDFTYTQTEEYGEWSFFTESPGTESVLWRSPLQPIIPMNMFTVELPAESVLKDINYTSTEKHLGEYELREQTGYDDLGEISTTSSSQSAGMPSDMLEYFTIRNPDNSLTLHIRVFPIQYDTDTNTVTLHDNMTITIEYEPSRSSRISYFYTEKPRVVKGRNADFLWQVENMASESQYLTARFSVSDTAGNLVTEFDDTVFIATNETEWFETSWIADMTPAVYVVRLALFDRDGLLVDRDIITLKVLAEAVTDISVIRRSIEEMSTSLWGSGSWLATEWVYLVSSEGSVNSAFAISPIASIEDTTIITTGTESLSESVQIVLPISGTDTITVVEVEDDFEQAVLGTIEELGYQVSIISGDSPIEFAATLATTNWSSSSEVVITLDKYPLAMLAGEYASYKRVPLLFIYDESVPSIVTETLDALGVTDITIISDNSINGRVISTLEEYTTDKRGKFQHISNSLVNQLAITVADMVQENPRMVVVASDAIDYAGAYLGLPNYVNKNDAIILLTRTLPDRSLSDSTISDYDLEELSQTLDLDFNYLSEREPEVLLILNPVGEAEDSDGEAGGASIGVIIGIIFTIIAALIVGYIIWRCLPKNEVARS